MNRKLLLLGDSIIDNKSYVLTSELDVTEHLKKLYSDQPDIIITNNAIDEDSIAEGNFDYLRKDFQKYHLYQSALAELKPFRKQKQGNKSQQMQKRTNAC